MTKLKVICVKDYLFYGFENGKEYDVFLYSLPMMENLIPIEGKFRDDYVIQCGIQSYAHMDKYEFSKHFKVLAQ